MTDLCKCCGQPLPRKSGKEITVSYWLKDTWAYSIEKKPLNSKLAQMTVPFKETFTKNGKRYYRLVEGHGESEDLLIEDADYDAV